jgi:hypothetical protein
MPYNTSLVRTIQINAASRQEQRARYLSGVASVLQKLLAALNDASSAVGISAVNRQSHHGLPQICNQLEHPAWCFKEMQRADG